MRAIVRDLLSVLACSCRLARRLGGPGLRRSTDWPGGWWLCGAPPLVAVACLALAAPRLASRLGVAASAFWLVGLLGLASGWPPRPLAAQGSAPPINTYVYI